MVHKIMAIGLILSAAALGIKFEGGDVTGAAVLFILLLPEIIKKSPLCQGGRKGERKKQHIHINTKYLKCQGGEKLD